MIACSGRLIWAPALFAQPENHMVWAGNAITLLAAAVAWIIAEAIPHAWSSGVPTPQALFTNS